MHYYARHNGMILIFIKRVVFWSHNKNALRIISTMQCRSNHSSSVYYLLLSNNAHNIYHQLQLPCWYFYTIFFVLLSFSVPIRNWLIHSCCLSFPFSPLTVDWLSHNWNFVCKNVTIKIVKRRANKIRVVEQRVHDENHAVLNKNWHVCVKAEICRDD